MKKVIASLLAVAMVGGMSAPVFADGEKSETITSLPGASTNDVDVIIDGVENLDTVYSVVVEWESLDFTYTYNTGASWDPATHTYTGTTVGNWDKESANVKVTNHSNADVSVAGSMNTNTKNGVTAALDNKTFDLVTGEGLTPETADNDTMTVSVSGTPTVDTGFTVGTVTVALSAKA